MDNRERSARKVLWLGGALIVSLALWAAIIGLGVVFFRAVAGAL